MMTVCANVMAQDASPTEKNGATPPDPIAERLERDLERLNATISDEPSRYHHERAEVFFRLSRFEESIRDYDAAVQFGWPHDDNSCWERGLAQYYAGKYREGAEQFARYHRVGALDIENGLWRLLCLAEGEGIPKARETMFDYPRKVREPFPALLNLYLDQGTAAAVIEEATTGDMSDQERLTRLFNAHYYLGKYYELVGQRELALENVREALKHRIPHFMYACAEIDAKRLETPPKPGEQHDES